MLFITRRIGRVFEWLDVAGWEFCEHEWKKMPCKRSVQKVVQHHKVRAHGFRPSPLHKPLIIGNPLVARLLQPSLRSVPLNGLMGEGWYLIEKVRIIQKIISQPWDFIFLWCYQVDLKTLWQDTSGPYFTWTFWEPHRVHIRFRIKDVNYQTKERVVTLAHCHSRGGGQSGITPTILIPIISA